MNTTKAPGYQPECLAVPFSAGAGLREIDHTRPSQRGTFTSGHARGVG